MRIRSAVAAVATLALTAGVMSSAAADPGDPATPPAAAAEDGTGADSAEEPGVEVAEQALADAQALLDEDPATQPVSTATPPSRCVTWPPTATCSAVASARRPTGCWRVRAPSA